MIARVVRWIAGIGMMAVGGFFILFAVGYAMEDPGGWAGAWISAAWIIPTVLLAWVAWTRPALGTRILLPPRRGGRPHLGGVPARLGVGA